MPQIFKTAVTTCGQQMSEICYCLPVSNIHFKTTGLQSVSPHENK